MRPLVTAALTVALVAACSAGGGDGTSGTPAPVPSVVLSSPRTRRSRSSRGREVRPRGLRPLPAVADRARWGQRHVLRGGLVRRLPPQPGSYDWSELDTVADQAESVGHELMQGAVGSCWATGGQVGRPGRQGQDGVRDSDRHGPIRRVLRPGRALRAGRDSGPSRTRSTTQRSGPAPRTSTRRWWSSGRSHRGAQPDAVILDSGLSSPTMEVQIVLGLLAGKDEEAWGLPAPLRTPRIAHPVRPPPITTLDELQTSSRRTSGSTTTRSSRRRWGWPRTASSSRLPDHFYERWGLVPLLMEFLRSRIPADMPIGAVRSACSTSTRPSPRRR